MRGTDGNKTSSVRACAPILSVGSGAHGHDFTGDRTGGRDLGTVPHRMSFPPPRPPLRGRGGGQGRPLLEPPALVNRAMIQLGVVICHTVASVIPSQ